MDREEGADQGVRTGRGQRVPTGTPAAIIEAVTPEQRMRSTQLTRPARLPHSLHTTYVVGNPGAHQPGNLSSEGFALHLAPARRDDAGGDCWAPNPDSDPLEGKPTSTWHPAPTMWQVNWSLAEYTHKWMNLSTEDNTESWL